MDALSQPPPASSRTHRPPPVHFLRPRYWWLVYHLLVLQFLCISCIGSLSCLLRSPLCQSTFCVPNVHIRYSKWHYCQLLCGRRRKGICLSPVVDWVPEFRSTYHEFGFCHVCLQSFSLHAFLPRLQLFEELVEGFELAYLITMAGPWAVIQVLQYPHLHGPVHIPDNNRWDTPPV